MLASGWVVLGRFVVTGQVPPGFFAGVPLRLEALRPVALSAPGGLGRRKQAGGERGRELAAP